MNPKSGRQQRCEAMVSITTAAGRQGYVMCGRAGAQLHHKLTRARGGLLLDAVGETYHHLYLCVEHHAYAHDNAHAIAGGLLIEGRVISGMEGEPIYLGPDPYLTQTYQKAAVA